MSDTKTPEQYEAEIAVLEAEAEMWHQRWERAEMWHQRWNVAARARRHKRLEDIGQLLVPRWTARVLRWFGLMRAS